jgi:hypothetical protein
MRSIRPTLAACVLVPAMMVASPAAAQDVQYETVTKIDLPGAAGTMLRLAARMGGGSTETIETTYIKGRMMRSDIDKQSTITDLENRRMIHLDHAAKTYSVWTFDQMIAQARAAGEAMKADQRTTSGSDQAETHVNFRFSVDDAKQREKIAGYDANRFFLTMEMEGEYVPEGETEREKGGTLVVLTEMWASTDVPVLQARENFDQTMAGEYAAASGQLMQGIAAAFADDPQLKVAFEASAKEIAKMDGMPVRTITRFVTVAPEHTFDRALAVDPKPQGASGRGGLGRFAARAAGVNVSAPPQQEREAPTQVTFMTVTSEIRKLSTGRVDAKLFEIPSNYKEAKQ